MRTAMSAAIAMLFLTLVHRAVAEPVSSLADGRTGRIEFRSVTPGGPTELVRRTYPAAGTVVSGTLVLPQAAEGPVPAMVIAHGSGGILKGREDLAKHDGQGLRDQLPNTLSFRRHPFPRP